MKYSAIQFDSDEKKLVHRFIGFPQKLYSKDTLVQDTKTEIALLQGKHILSHYFDVYPFLAFDEYDNTAARCLLTVYHDQKCAYIGYFECIDSDAAAKCIMSAAEKKAHQLGCTSVIGPVDASFWIRYRLKTNCFDQPPYTGEPYNMPYYARFFTENGYSVCGEYISNRYGIIEPDFINEKNVRRLNRFKDMGYVIKSPDKSTFEQSLREVYGLLISLYSNFQTFSMITEDEFCRLYAPMKFAADLSMVKIAYFNDVPVGFSVNLPNYGNASSGRHTPSKLLKMLRIKKAPKDYILLYLGVNRDHLGLGKAVTEDILCRLSEKKAVSIGALIRRGKVTGTYFSKIIEKEYEYLLYEKKLP